MTKKHRKSEDEQPADNFKHKVEDAFKKINIDTADNESVENKADLKEASAAEDASSDASAEEKAGLAETAAAEDEAAVSASSAEASGADQPEQSAAPDEPSTDDLLEDVRRSLIEDEAQSAEKKSGWLSRLTKGFHKDQPVSDSTVAEEPLPPTHAETAVPAQTPTDDQYLDEIDELIDMLEPEVEAPKPEPVEESEASPLPEPEAPVDMEELKRRVFSPSAGAEPQDISEVRSVALEGEGGEEVFVEVEATRVDTAEERRKAFQNAMRPVRQYVYFAIAVVGIVLAVVVVGMMYTFYQNTRPPEPTPIESNLPYPVAMSLPGGLSFNLEKGSIVEGVWNPTGPEWLRGTEICRWVAIPWSKQLEAVVRTLTQEDSIELVMSNNDRLTYDVFSIQQLTLAEMQALDQNSPCLLLVLAEQDAEKRWVVTARP